MDIQVVDRDIPVEDTVDTPHLEGVVVEVLPMVEVQELLMEAVIPQEAEEGVELMIILLLEEEVVVVEAMMHHLRQLLVVDVD